MWTGKRSTGWDITRAISTLRQFWCRGFNLLGDERDDNVNNVNSIQLNEAAGRQ